MNGRLALGLDLSTQSITASVIDMSKREAVCQISLDYLADGRLNTFGLNDDYLLPPDEPGEANQPVALFLAAVDAIMHDMSVELPAWGFKASDIGVVNFSVQQHGHVYLNEQAETSFGSLDRHGSPDKGTLQEILNDSFVLPVVKTWRTACTAEQADFIRERAGGCKRLVELSGSDAPLRFSALSIRKTAEDYPHKYARTTQILLLDTFLASVFTGNLGTPLNYGSACGLSLMDYRARQWSDELLSAASEGLPGYGEELRAKLPPLASGMTVAGTVEAYFVEKFGMDPGCLVGLGCGDNAQSKVLSPGTVLSLGTSFVLMADFDGKSFDLSGNSNAMYDPLDRPFMFGCRTNGAMRWDEIRREYGYEKSDYALAEEALTQTPPGNEGKLFIWQAETESFPRSPAFAKTRIGYDEPSFAHDYCGIVESTLGIVYLYSRDFTAPSDEMYVTGGAASSPQVLRRIAAIWDRTVVPVSGGGSALGAAISGACALLTQETVQPGIDEFISSFLTTGEPVAPLEVDVRAYRDSGGFLDTLQDSYANLIV